MQFRKHDTEKGPAASRPRARPPWRCWRCHLCKSIQRRVWCCFFRPLPEREREKIRASEEGDEERVEEALALQFDEEFGEERVQRHSTSREHLSLTPEQRRLDGRVAVPIYFCKFVCFLTRTPSGVVCPGSKREEEKRSQHSAASRRKVALCDEVLRG